MEDNKKNTAENSEKCCGKEEKKDCETKQAKKECCHAHQGDEQGANKDKKECCHKEQNASDKEQFASEKEQSSKDKHCSCKEGNFDKEHCDCEDKECSCHDEHCENCSCEQADRQAAIEQLTAQLTESAEKYIRLYADFENYKKRAVRDRNEALSYACVPIMEKLILVLDNFDRALESGANPEQDTKNNSFYEGVALVARQLKELLASEGLKEMDSLNKPFDPMEMNAVMVGSDPEKEEDTVIEVFQRGYKYKDRVIRPCMVKVNKH
ncbi:MAG: nucleotide exchange factor GrpE [Eubacteriaceae bacterium]|nr:nucleotide exchange factor GrpE [Eubacteriaceae bacterium]